MYIFRRPACEVKSTIPNSQTDTGQENNGENHTECFEMVNSYKNVPNSENAQLLVYSLIGFKFGVI
jgi:hypothetical protein